MQNFVNTLQRRRGRRELLEQSNFCEEQKPMLWTNVYQRLVTTGFRIVLFEFQVSI